MVSQNSGTPEPDPCPWTHRVAWALLCATFALIYVGGAVTTYRAGMAVEDWPTTHDYWFYPLQKWAAGTWDLFLEHGHRMLAQTVGLLTIGLLVMLWRNDRRRWMRWLGVAALAGVIAQGVIGGLRVVFQQPLLAMVHGCTGPLFLCLCAALVALTSARWLCDEGPQSHPAARRLHATAAITVAAIYLQIVLGAQLRHLPVGAAPGWFELWIWLKLGMAGLILVWLVWLLVWSTRRAGDRAMILRRARWLVGLFCGQLVLGAGSWVTNYGWPAWFTDYVLSLRYTVVAGGRLQALVSTGHAAVGSLTLVTALSLLLWSRRLLEGAGKRERG